MARRRSPRQVDPTFATMEEVMAAAGASYRTIQNWMKRGLVPTPRAVASLICINPMVPPRPINCG